MTTTTSKTHHNLLSNNRFWILLFGGFLSVLVFVSVWSLIPGGDNLRLIRLQQLYGFIGIVFIYIAILATPLTKVFVNFPGRETYLHARRAIGVSAFYFSSLHTGIVLFGQLGGLSNISYLTGLYQLSLFLGCIALLILFLMALTSFDKVIDKMGFSNWKKLHRFIYLASFLLIIHVALIGTHFAYGASPVSYISIVGVFILALFELTRINMNLGTRMKAKPLTGSMLLALLYLLILGAGVIVGNNQVDLSGEKTHSSHGETSQHGEEYVSFDPVANLDDRAIRISQKQLSQESLIAGKTLQFDITPNYADLNKVSCFLVNQETYLYTHGFAKINENGVECLPIGDTNPPQPGFYTIYLRLERSGQVSTVPFNLEITQ